jgi:hypothetical protein
LSSLVAAQTSTANGQVTSSLVQIASTLSQQSNAISTNAGAIVTVTSTAASNTVMINALRNAIISAALVAPSGGSGQSYPSIAAGGPDGNTLSVDSGSCNVTDLCAATSFAATLKQTLLSL